jgi:hypothetical protein
MLTLLLSAALAATTASQTITVEVLSPAQYEQSQRDEAARTTLEVDTEETNTQTECSGNVCTAKEV